MRSRGPHGRPELPKVATHSGGGAVSLAHTGRYALAGCARGGSIGVDLEAPRGVAIDARRRDIIITAARALTAAPLLSGEGACMLQSWVRLEALAKADGRGIGHLLAAIGAIGGGGNATGATTLAALGGIEVRDLDTGPALYGAVALTRGAGAVSLFAAPDAIAHLLDVGLIPTR